MNDNKLLLDQVVLKKEVGEDGTINFKALAYSIVEHRAINMTTEVLDDKTIVMTPVATATYPFTEVQPNAPLVNEEALTAILPGVFDAFDLQSLPEGSPSPDPSNVH